MVRTGWTAGSPARRRTSSRLAPVLVAALALVAPVPAARAAPERARAAELPRGVVEAFPDLAFVLPTELVDLPVTPPRFLVLEQRGRVLTFEKTPGARRLAVALDLTERMKPGDWMGGLLGLVADPRFPVPPEVYLFYTGQRALRVSRFTVDAAGTRLSPESEVVLIEQEVGNDFHHGGALAFGPDGHLYVSIGDIGPQHDPDGVAQDLGQWRGKVLRLDVRRHEPGRACAVPRDNPFARRPGARPEIWAYGFRNVWRMSFDARGRLWAGDVGQLSREEIDLVRAGGNHGWNPIEGRVPHVVPGEPGPRPLSGRPIAPWLDYGRDLGTSVTAGFVYEGRAFPALRGRYLFGDWGSGRIWAVPLGARALAPEHELLRVPQVNSIARDRRGEPYFVSMNGRIYALSARGGALEPELPLRWEDSPLLAVVRADAGARADAREEGRRLFGQGCQLCHGAQGEGALGPNLRDDHWMKGGALPEIARSIAEGSQYTGMPAWRMVYPPAQIAALAVYVAGLRCGPAIPGKAPEGKPAPPALACNDP